MREINKKYFWIVWLSVSVLSFIMFIIGVRGILGNEITTQNAIAFAVLSIIFGGISSAFYYIKAKIGVVIFFAGLCIGFFEMFRTFINGMAGWGDLIGLMSLFTWAIIGLVAGAVAQLVWYLYKKLNKPKNGE